MHVVTYAETRDTDVKTLMYHYEIRSATLIEGENARVGKHKVIVDLIDAVG